MSKIDLSKVASHKGPVNFIGKKAETMIVELHHAEVMSLEYGIPVNFVNYTYSKDRNNPDDKMSLNWGGKVLARTIEERDILLKAIRDALETNNFEDLNCILKQAHKKIIWSFIERGYWPNEAENMAKNIDEEKVFLTDIEK